MNSNLFYKNRSLTMDGTDLHSIVQKFGTPLYLYSEKSIQNSYASFQKGIGSKRGLVCFSVKSNSNINILRLIARLGGGFDIVSGGELYRTTFTGVEPSKIVFSGVGKSEREIVEALDAGILLFIVESEWELNLLSKLASERGTTARISVRVNPDVDAKTHEYISTGLKENKFGISFKDVIGVYKRSLTLPGILPEGIGFHIGSQIVSLEPFREAAAIINRVINELSDLGINIKYIDVGGGLGINYSSENPPAPEDFTKAILSSLKREDLTVIFEPGRSLVGNSGVLLTKILYSKKNEAKNFYICDAAMNDLVRPSYYNAYHEILPFNEERRKSDFPSDLVGPVCETGDFLARSRYLPDFKNGDYAAILSAGAYGFSMSSNYNSRLKPAEVLIQENGEAKLIRKRDQHSDLILNEVI